MLRFYVLLCVLITGFLTAMPAAQAESKTDTGLLWILPDHSDVKSLKAVDSPQQAKGDELFKLINGGAEVFLQAGFVRAVLQDYRAEGGALFNLEIYQMDSPDNARKVFAQKTGPSAQSVNVGQGSSLEDYYGLFWQGSYFISITASKGTKENRHVLKKIVQAVVKRIIDKGSNSK